MKWSILAFMILLCSCTKEKSCGSCENEAGFVDATIIFTGPLETDGCDWTVKIGDDKYYHPDKLDAEFRQNELDVKICYEIAADKFHCGIAGSGMTVIHVLAIKK